MDSNRAFLYGADETERVVSIETSDGEAVYFIETEGGVVESTRPNEYFILYSDRQDEFCLKLRGELHYQYAKKFDSQKTFYDAVNAAKAKKIDHYVIFNRKEQHMVKYGATSFKGMTPPDVSVLSFDIEATGLDPEKEDAKVLLISTTARRGTFVERKLFAYDEYESEKEMINAWCDYVRQFNPSILLGHHIFNYDLPYLRVRAGGSLRLGRDGSAAYFPKNSSEFRKDGSQSYEYKNITIYGREIIDTFHLAIKYDIGRKYESYALKSIIKEEGLEREDRQHFDASLIRTQYQDKEKWAEIKKYAEHDADDALALYDLMIPAFFYLAQIIPKPFQQVINSATGSQVNAFLTRAYLQNKHSIPKASQTGEYQGAISFGNPGIYKNVYKVDVASLYPSIIREFKVYDAKKDPDAAFLKMVDILTVDRLKNKALAKETKERRYEDLQQSQKLLINSAYGFMGAPGLNFNSPENASFVTKKGREILQSAISWAQAADYKIVNADTDSISYTTGKKLTDEEVAANLDALNCTVPPLIRWEDDGYYKVVVVIKAKNYILYDGKEVKLKGNSLKATMKEPALKEFIGEVVNLLVADRLDRIYSAYQRYAREIKEVKDIGRWCSKKTVTASVLAPERTNEQRVLDAIAGEEISEGDKVYVFYKTADALATKDQFDGQYDKKRLYEKLYKTVGVFSTVIDLNLFPNLALKRNEDLRENW